MKTSRILGTALVALLLVFASEVQAQTQAASLDGYLRAFTLPVTDLQAAGVNDPDRTSTSSTATHVAGANGIVAVATMAGVTGIAQGCALGGAACTSSVAALPYSAKLVISLYDSGANGTLACGSGGRIYGRTPGGRQVEERIPALTEAVRYHTTYAYERVDRFYVQGCSASGTTTGDQLVVAVSTAIATPYPIRSLADLTRICRGDGPLTPAGANVQSQMRCVDIRSGVASGVQTYRSGITVDANASTVDFSDLVVPPFASAAFNPGADFIVYGRAAR